MGLFSWKGNDEKAGDPATAADVNARPESAAMPHAAAPPPPPRKKSRSCVYSVRVRESSKGEVLEIQAEMQLERRSSGRKARKITEKEIIELALEMLKVARRNGMGSGHAVPIPNDVWDGLEELARRQKKSMAEMFEELVVDRFVELERLSCK